MKKNIHQPSGQYPFHFTHLEKAYYRSPAITKGEVLAYYEKIASNMLPFTRNRPDTMRRFPEGIAKEGFFQKDISDFFPAWVDRKRVKSRQAGPVHYVLCNKRATLVYLAQLGTIEHHLWLSKTDKLDYPDKVIFDLDPPGKEFALVIFGALQLKSFCRELGLHPFVKTTGSKGLHIVIPIRRSWGFDRVRAFARGMAEVLAARFPDKLTTEQRLNKRKGRLYLDMNRNAFGQTAVAPYSLRARKGAPIATPVAWQEITRKGFHSQKYHIRNIFTALKKRKDPWAEMRQSAVGLSAAHKQVEALHKKLIKN